MMECYKLQEKHVTVTRETANAYVFRKKYYKRANYNAKRDQKCLGDRKKEETCV